SWGSLRSRRKVQALKVEGRWTGLGRPTFRPGTRDGEAYPVRDDPRPLRRQHALGVELDALDGEAAVAEAHDRAVVGPRRDLQRLRQRGPVGHEGVVA